MQSKITIFVIFEKKIKLADLADVSPRDQEDNGGGGMGVDLPQTHQNKVYFCFCDFGVRSVGG